MGTLLSAISPPAQPFSQTSCVGLPRRPRRAEEKVSAARGGRGGVCVWERETQRSNGNEKRGGPGARVGGSGFRV